MPHPTGYRQLRKGRFSEQNRVYHVTTRTRDRRPVFDSFERSRILIHAMKDQHDEGCVDSLCFVVMPDHLHWLFGLRGDSQLGDVIRFVKSRSARLINRQDGSSGPLWQPGFHDHAVRKEEDLQSIARYIVANPLRSGLVNSLRHYPHWDAVWI